MRPGDQSGFPGDGVMDTPWPGGNVLDLGVDNLRISLGLDHG